MFIKAIYYRFFGDNTFVGFGSFAVDVKVELEKVREQAQNIV